MSAAALGGAAGSGEAGGLAGSAGGAAAAASDGGGGLAGRAGRTGAAGSGAAGELAGRGSGGGGSPGGLERAYRRLLAAYPRQHRAEHGEEMLGVLMAGATEGQVRPGAGDAANLVAGGLRVRLRRAAGCFATPPWQDALAVLSLLVPALLVTLLAESLNVTDLVFFVSGKSGPLPTTWWILAAPAQLLLLAGWLTVVALGLMGRRPGAIALAAAMTAGQLLVLVMIVTPALAPPPLRGTPWWDNEIHTPAGLFLGTLSLAALAGSGGPRRGLAILGRGRVWLIAAGLAAWVAAHQPAIAWVAVPSGWFHTPVAPLLLRVSSVAAIVVGIPLGVMCLRSPAGRRALAMALPALSPHGVLYLAWLAAGAGPGSPYGPQFDQGQPAAELTWALYLVLAAGVIALAVAGVRRRSAGPLAASPGG